MLNDSKLMKHYRLDKGSFLWLILLQECSYNAIAKTESDPNTEIRDIEIELHDLSLLSSLHRSKSSGKAYGSRRHVIPMNWHYMTCRPEADHSNHSEREIVIFTIAGIQKSTSTVKNWMGPSLDIIHTYWLKKLHFINACRHK